MTRWHASVIFRIIAKKQVQWPKLSIAKHCQMHSIWPKHQCHHNSFQLAPQFSWQVLQISVLWSKQGSCTIPPEPEQELHDWVSARGAHTAWNEIDCAWLDRLFSPGWLRSSSYDGSPLPSSLVGMHQHQRGCHDEFGMGLTMKQGCESNQRHHPTIPLH